MQSLNHAYGSKVIANKSDIFNKMHDLDREINAYTFKLRNHPIVKYCQQQILPLEILNDFAKVQFVDSVLWIPMLALIKGKIKSPRLLKAVRANMLCEAGADGIPHVTLCQKFIESLGIMPRYGDYNEFTKYSSHPVEIMMSIQDFDEPFITGWLLAAEALVPVMFSVFKEAYQNTPGVDLTYLNEHIVIDADEHAEWMRESAQELMMASDCFEQIKAGIDIGARLTLAIPDVLFAKTIRLLKMA